MPAKQPWHSDFDVREWFVESGHIATPNKFPLGRIWTQREQAFDLVDHREPGGVQITVRTDNPIPQKAQDDARDGDQKVEALGTQRFSFCIYVAEQRDQCCVDGDEEGVRGLASLTEAIGQLKVYPVLIESNGELLGR